jgi:YD repeat-containing protein
VRFAGAYTDPRYSEAKYVVDAYGNRTSVTLYPGLGTATAPSTVDGRTTITTYETTYRTYPIYVDNSLSHRITIAYGDYVLGLPASITDANGVETRLEYDTFGRLTAVRKYGDYTGTPTMAFSYHTATEPFGGKPFWTEAVQKVDATHTFAIRKFYTSLGQLIQTQQVGAEVNGVLKDILTDYYYDSAGRMFRQSAPYAVATGSQVFIGRDLNQPYSLTTFDVLGRPLTVTAPDGTPTAYTYPASAANPEYNETRLTDANGNTTASFTNAWGQTVAVVPPTGPGVSYEYYATGQLFKVTYGANAEDEAIETTLFYDLAGRKTSMDDPDMGEWSYTYDALGNLLTQTDARTCVTTLAYDKLNRLTGKTFSGAGACGATSAISYTYDQGGAPGQSHRAAHEHERRFRIHHLGVRRPRAYNAGEQDGQRRSRCLRQRLDVQRCRPGGDDDLPQRRDGGV